MRLNVKTKTKTEAEVVAIEDPQGSTPCGRGDDIFSSPLIKSAPLIAFAKSLAEPRSQ